MQEGRAHFRKKSAIGCPSASPWYHPASRHPSGSSSRQRLGLEQSASCPKAQHFPRRGQLSEHHNYTLKPAGRTCHFLFSSFPPNYEIIPLVIQNMFEHILNHVLERNFSCPDLQILVCPLSPNKQNAKNLQRSNFHDLMLFKRKP